MNVIPKIFHSIMFLYILLLSTISYTTGMSETVGSDRDYEPDNQVATLAPSLVFSGVLTEKLIERMKSEVSLRGELIIDETVNMAEDDMNSLLSRQFTIDGALIIRNTLYESLKFSWTTSPLKNGDVTLIIRNNTMLKNFVFDVTVRSSYGEAKFENNPKLDYVSMCEMLHSVFFNRINFVENPHQCGCFLNASSLTTSIVSSLPENCTAIYGDMRFTSLDTPSYELAESKFSALKLIYGALSVVGTNYEDLGFLSSIRRIYNEKVSQSKDAGQLLISGNSQLKKLSWLKLEQVEQTRIIITNNPLMCLQLSEHFVFLYGQFINNITFTLCEDQIMPKNFYRIVNDKWEDTPYDATILVGDVNINETSDLTHFINLANITMIYGHLSIINSKLKTNNWLDNLKDMYISSEDRPAILVENNTDLRILQIHLFTNNLQIVVKNNPRLKFDRYSCQMIVRDEYVLLAGNGNNCEDEREFLGMSEKAASVISKLFIVVHLIALLL